MGLYQEPQEITDIFNDIETATKKGSYMGSAVGGLIGIAGSVVNSGDNWYIAALLAVPLATAAGFTIGGTYSLVKGVYRNRNTIRSPAGELEKVHF